MDKEQVDGVDSEPFQTVLDRSLQRSVADDLRPNLGCDEDLFARHGRVVDAFADRGLIVVTLGRINVTETDAERLGDDLCAW